MFYMNCGKHKVVMILVCFGKSVHVLCGSFSEQTFHAEALKDPEFICMEDKIMKNCSPILKCHMYLPSVKFEIWMYYFDIVCVFDFPACTTKKHCQNALPTNKYK